jgi:F-box/leucine-rich repeat protein 2/20
MEENEAEWSELTQECLINILSRLTVEDQWRGTMLVCKSWFNAFNEPSLHSVFNLDPYFDSPSESPRWWTFQFESKIDSMLRSVAQWTHLFLTQIRIRHCSDRSLTLVAERSNLSSKLEIGSAIIFLIGFDSEFGFALIAIYYIYVLCLISCLDLVKLNFVA